MKMKTQWIAALMLGAMLSAEAQFNTFPVGPFTIGATTNPITSVGIGNFGPAQSTQSRLHVSNFLLNSPNNATYNGFLFRTDGNNSVDNMWQLFTGPKITTISEKLRIYIPASTSNVFINAFQKNGNMQLQTAGFTRIFIQDNSSGPLSGYVGVNNVSPQNNLEITNNITSPTTANPLTGGTGASGLRLTKLTVASAPQTNPGKGVLTVDRNGDVILVPDQTGTGGGNANLCATIPVNNVTKNIGGNNLCQTNITDLFPTPLVGINTTVPNDALDVNKGNVDVVTPTFAYKIGDQEMLWHKGNNTNVFLGVNAAFSHNPNQNAKNTIIGSRAGYSGTGGVLVNDQNVLVGYEAGFNNTGATATYIGYQAGYTHGSSTTGNTFVGYQSGYNTLGGSNDNTMVGKFSGLGNTSGDQNVFVGNVAGSGNTTGGYNSFLGTGAGSGNTVHNFNTCLGAGAGAAAKGDENTFAGYSSGSFGIGNFNVALGSRAMQSAVTGAENTIIGYKANSTSTGSSFNTIIGSQAALNNSTGANNTYVGYHTALNQTAGTNNAYLGYNSGLNTATGTNNTFLGGSTDATNANSNLTNAAAIGANAKVTNNNHMILGDNTVNAGIGLSGDATGPQNKLELNTTAGSPYFGSPNGSSGLRFRNMTTANTPGTNPGKGVLTVDANGDVILVNDQTGGGNGCCIGNPCIPGNPVGTNPLLTDWQVPMNNHNYIFQGTSGTAGGNVGIGIITPCSPGNLLEVSKGTAPNTMSGLRLTDLASFPTPLASNGQVLSVDVNGDVILTSASAATSGPGNYCASSQSPLTGNYEMPLGAFQYHFTGQGSTGTAANRDIVSVGYSCSQNPPSRFSVLESQVPAPGFVTYAAHFRNDNITSVGSGILTGGIYAQAKGQVGGPSATPQINAGGVFEGYGSDANIGACGRNSHSSLPSSIGPRYSIGGVFMSDTTNSPVLGIPNYGVYAHASNSSVANFGVYADVPGASGILSYAIYGKTGTFNNGLGLDYAGYFDGDVFTTATSYYTSDKNLKKDIKKLDNSLDLINKLNPVTYNFDTESNKGINLPGVKQYGFISQEVKEILPEFTKTAVHPAQYDKDGNEVAPKKEILGLNYNGFIAILTKGIQEQQSQIDSQQKQIDELKAMVKSLAGNPAGDSRSVNSQAVDLSDKNVIVLDQNVPNPFAENTTITYNIPTDFAKAQLIFSTTEGKVIKVIDLTSKGAGRISVFANDLSSGMYSYSLIVDGKTIDTKRMVKE